MSEYMNALVLEGIGDLQYKQVEKPVAKKGEVLVRVRACGICSSDIARVFKTGTYHFPTIPGHEFSGEVVELGEGVDESYMGRRVAVFPLLPCGECAPCQKEEYAQCKNYNYFGSRCDGGFAEYLSVPVWNLIPFSNNVSFEEGALCEPFAVSLHAFKMADIKENQTVAIVGTGTIGFMIAELARRAGASKVIVCGRSENKLEFAKKLKFETINIKDENAVDKLKEITASDGANYVFECVGSPESINQSVEYCAAFGTVVVVGNPTGDITFNKTTYWKILRQQLTLKGTWNSSYNSHVNDWKEALEMFENGKVDFKPFISKTFTMDHSEEAFKTLMNPNIFTLKVMFTI